MKKYWKNAKNTGKVYEKILEKCKKKLEKSGKFVSPKKWEPCDASYARKCSSHRYSDCRHPCDWMEDKSEIDKEGYHADGQDDENEENETERSSYGKDNLQDMSDKGEPTSTKPEEYTSTQQEKPTSTQRDVQAVN